jgi:hypothetical protein
MQGDNAQPKSATTIPTEAPVMLLPNGSLFPNALLPLYIFEEKYRCMLRHCLEHDRMFCDLSHPGVLSDIVAHAFIQDPEQRQELLEELAVSGRLRMLIAHLGRLAQ